MLPGRFLSISSKNSKYFKALNSFRRNSQDQGERFLIDFPDNDEKTGRPELILAATAAQKFSTPDAALYLPIF